MFMSDRTYISICNTNRSTIINHYLLYPNTPVTCKYIAQASTLVFMLTTTVITAVIGVFGVVAAGIGINRIIRDPRRIAAYAYAIAALGAALLSLGLVVFLQAGSPVLLAITMFAALALLLLGNLVAYPALVVFLLWAGITNVRCESRSLANLLAQAAGIGLVLIPDTLDFLEPTGEVRNDLIYHLQYGLHPGLSVLVTYVSFCFGAFAIASVAYP